MTAPAFSQEEFDAALSRIVARGDTPSVRNLLEELNGGSHTTIGRMLLAWHQKQMNGPNRKSPPAKVTAKGNEYIAAVWAAAQQQAAEELDAVRLHFDSECGVLKKQLQDNLRGLDEMKAECDQLKRSLQGEVEARESACRSRFDADVRAARLEEENSQLRATIAALKQDREPNPIPAKLLEEFLRLAQEQAPAIPARTRPRGAGKTKGAIPVT